METLYSIPPARTKDQLDEGPVEGTFLFLHKRFYIRRGCTCVHVYIEGDDTMAKIPYNQLSKELKRLKQILKNVPQDRQPIAESLFDELAFMDRTMQSLREQVNKDGPISLFKQGKQEFLREHPALTAYNKTIQRYNQTLKQLIDLLPKTDGQSEADPLLEFIKGGK